VSIVIVFIVTGLLSLVITALSAITSESD
jgi:hypothetical protein